MSGRRRHQLNPFVRWRTGDQGLGGEPAGAVVRESQSTIKSCRGNALPHSVPRAAIPLTETRDRIVEVDGQSELMRRFYAAIFDVKHAPSGARAAPPQDPHRPQARAFAAFGHLDLRHGTARPRLQFAKTPRPTAHQQRLAGTRARARASSALRNDITPLSVPLAPRIAR
ncbi:hypothetical protein EVAR_4838_1 [Eumeta japonica]|uniref:Uncharacterized protein n=1 Tax=Eumeta variegata TaxID=151549 RepID=A0A4C1SZT4_EUMVA|nr:hypothetical protein EVAR_4838_1 [Eumeta japonica]